MIQLETSRAPNPQRYPNHLSTNSGTDEVSGNGACHIAASDHIGASDLVGTQALPGLAMGQGASLH